MPVKVWARLGGNVPKDKPETAAHTRPTKPHRRCYADRQRATGERRGTWPSSSFHAPASRILFGLRSTEWETLASKTAPFSRSLIMLTSVFPLLALRGGRHQSGDGHRGVVVRARLVSKGKGVDESCINTRT